MLWFAPHAMRVAVSLVACNLYLFSASASVVAPEKLIEQGHFKRAKAKLSTYLQHHPDDPHGNFQMSKVFAAYLRPDESIQHAEKALSSDNNNPDFHTQLAEAIAVKLISNDVSFYEKVPLVSRFRQEIDLALQLNPKTVRANTDLVQFYLSAPALLGGSYDKALATAEQLIQWDPVDGYLMVAKVAAAQGKNQDTIEKLLNQAAQAEPKSYEAQISLADFYSKNQKSALAQECARRAIQIDAQRINAYIILATVDAEQHNWKQLQAHLSESERNIPDDFAPYFQSARTILLTDTKDQFSLAEKFFRKYLSQEPEALQPGWSKAHWRLGQLLDKQGRKEEAKKEFQVALQLEPGLKEAQQDLKRLQ